MTTAIVKEVYLKSKERVLKVLQYGAKTADECAPFGIDSSPIKDMLAIYSSTSESGESFIIGYLNRNQIAEQGETRLYSLKENGDLSFSVYLKKDGTLEVGGDTDNLVRYAGLNEVFQQQTLKINAELTKIATGITSAGGAYTPELISVDATPAKIEEIKCL